MPSSTTMSGRPLAPRHEILDAVIAPRRRASATTPWCTPPLRLAVEHIGRHTLHRDAALARRARASSRNARRRRDRPRAAPARAGAQRLEDRVDAVDDHRSSTPSQRLSGDARAPRERPSASADSRSHASRALAAAHRARSPARRGRAPALRARPSAPGGSDGTAPCPSAPSRSRTRVATGAKRVAVEQRRRLRQLLGQSARSPRAAASRFLRQTPRRSSARSAE